MVLLCKFQQNEKTCYFFQGQGWMLIYAKFTQQLACPVNHPLTYCSVIVLTTECNLQLQ